MREKVTGIGKEIALLMEKNNVTLKELAEKTGIRKRLLKQFIELKKEPYVIPEGQKILPAIGLKTEEEFELFIKKWIQLAEKNEIANNKNRNLNKI